jgi:uncharacterized protein (DUF1810 family)
MMPCVAASDPFQLQRFVEAQESSFAQALDELRAGMKQSHWMWFIFPQLAGLGRSPTAQYYAIASRDEALAYLSHPLLGPRFRQSVEAIEQWAGERTAEEILGPVDAIKLRSSLTLFDAVEPDGPFGRALQSFFPGPDERTLALLGQSR